MKRFDLQKNNFINYAGFLDRAAPIENNLRQKKENSPPKSVENSREKTINELKNLFELIIQSENNKIMIGVIVKKIIKNFVVPI